MREWLATRRKAIHKTQDEVAKELNVSAPYYCLIEQGKRMQRMDIPFAIALAKAVQMPLEEIIEREGIV